MRLFQRLFYQPEYTKNTVSERSIYRLLVSSVISIFICAVCLCGASWAWFTASTSAGTTSIKTPEYRLTYQIGTNTEAAEITEADNTYTLTEDTCKITLKAIGTAGATGYCSITVGSETYYTEQIFIDDTFTFTVNAAEGTTITITPKWGTYSGTANISNSGSIGTASNPLSLAAQTDGDEESEEEPKPEEETTTPDPSATTPIDPETTNTEPTPAPEITQPEETTETQMTEAADTTEQTASSDDTSGATPENAATEQAEPAAGNTENAE